MSRKIAKKLKSWRYKDDRKGRRDAWPGGGSRELSLVELSLAGPVRGLHLVTLMRIGS